LIFNIAYQKGLTTFVSTRVKESIVLGGFVFHRCQISFQWSYRCETTLAHYSRYHLFLMSFYEMLLVVKWKNILC